MRKFKHLYTACGVMFCAPVLAISNVSYQADVLGSALLTLTKEHAVVVSDVDDLSLVFTQHTSYSAFVMYDDVCVFSSTTAYQVRAISSNGEFALVGEQDKIAYSVIWDAREMRHASPVYQVNSELKRSNCEQGQKTRYEVRVNPFEFMSARAGVYLDTLTLMIEPE